MLTHPIEFDADLKRDDYFEAIRLNQRSSPDTYRPWRIANIIGAGAGFALLFGAEARSWPAPAALIALGLFNILYPIFRRAQDLSRAWSEYSQRWGNARYQLSEECIRVHRPHVRMENEWHAFKRFAETRNLFLLYRADTASEIIPKRSVPDVPLVRAILREKLTRGESAFPVIMPPN